MGCACSCRRREVDGLSLSSAGCCHRCCCCCGLCSVVHPFSGKRDTTTSTPSVSVLSSAGRLGITPESPCESANIQHCEQIDLPTNPRANTASDEGGPPSFGTIRDVGEAPLLSPEQIKEQFFRRNEETLHVADKKSRGFGSIESILLPSDDEDNCPICLEEYDKENPRVDTLCEHHYHFCCILEWMERSDNCPMCDKEIVLYESL